MLKNSWKMAAMGGAFLCTLAYTAFPVQAAWVEQAGKWKYYGADGAVQKGWLQSGKDWYYLDGDTGVMRTGWLQTGDGAWYFLNPVSDGQQGKMLTGWQWIDGYAYYLGVATGSEEGKLLVQTVTPDGYRVDASGRWTDAGQKAVFEEGKGIQTKSAAKDKAKSVKTAARRSGGGGGGGGSTGGATSASKSENQGSVQAQPEVPQPEVPQPQPEVPQPQPEVPQPQPEVPQPQPEVPQPQPEVPQPQPEVPQQPSAGARLLQEFYYCNENPIFQFEAVEDMQAINISYEKFGAFLPLASGNMEIDEVNKSIAIKTANIRSNYNGVLKNADENMKVKIDYRGEVILETEVPYKAFRTDVDINADIHVRENEEARIELENLGSEDLENIKLYKRIPKEGQSAYQEEEIGREAWRTEYHEGKSYLILTAEAMPAYLEAGGTKLLIKIRGVKDLYTTLHLQKDVPGEEKKEIQARLYVVDNHDDEWTDGEKYFYATTRDIKVILQAEGLDGDFVKENMQVRVQTQAGEDFIYPGPATSEADRWKVEKIGGNELRVRIPAGHSKIGFRKIDGQFPYADITLEISGYKALTLRVYIVP